MKAVVAAFNQEKALVGAFSVITTLRMQFGCNFLRHVGHNNITWPLLVSPSTQLVALLRGPDCGVLHPPDEIPRGGVAVVVGVGAAQPAASRGLM